MEEYGKVLIPTYKYSTERDGDTLGNENMLHGINFDSIELLKEDIGFFIAKDEFLNYIHKRGYEIFRNILTEKRIISDRSNHNERYKQPHYSGIYEINQDGTIKGDFNILFD